MKKIFKVVIVGASSGIGRALAVALASRGVHVGIAARNLDALKELKSQFPDTIQYHRIDVNNDDAPVELLKLVDKLGGMDIYIHAAGVGYENPDLNTDFEVKTIQTNTVGFARLISSVYRYYRDHKNGGQIAAITSVAGGNGIADMAAYSASKRFQYTYLVALEQLNRRQNAGVYFTDIRPGWVRTPLLQSDKSYPMEMSVQEVVPLILKAIIRRKRVAYIDCRWGVVAAIWRLIPDSVWTHFSIDVK